MGAPGGTTSGLLPVSEHHTGPCPQLRHLQGEIQREPLASSIAPPAGSSSIPAGLPPDMDADFFVHIPIPQVWQPTISLPTPTPANTPVPVSSDPDFHVPIKSTRQ